ncbi:MarC family NAAT transporter [Halopseudomonas pelagia]|uniref:MarC family NAAT transporter n=1 Tax=Halopseudomonas pelagia TaxID=553151 RepID=UPI0003A7B256|nr:MarC family NAAT transporter [Halopseudomonas pelagia]
MDQVIELFTVVGLGVALMLPLANPLTSVTLLLSLGRTLSIQERNRQITQATIYVVAIMLITYFSGHWVMQSFGISIPGLRIAGGLIVAFIGFTMLFPTHAVDDIPEAEANADAAARRKPINIAFVPLALPGTAGPGTIAFIISAAASTRPGTVPYSTLTLMLAPVIVFIVLGAIFWVCLRYAGRIVKIIGEGGVEAIARVMGFLLVCMGVQFLINGILEIVTQYAA